MECGNPARPLPWPLVVAGIAALLAGLAVLVGGFLNSGLVRHAGWPHEPELLGVWVLDRTRGDFDPAPPELIEFVPGSGSGLVRISDGVRVAEFSLPGGPRLEYGAGPDFEPLLPAGRSEVNVMTHLCPPLPAWDHLTFFPDGTPTGGDPTQRMINYERE